MDNYFICPVCTLLITDISKDSILCHNCKTTWINSIRIEGHIE